MKFSTATFEPVQGNSPIQLAMPAQTDDPIVRNYLSGEVSNQYLTHFVLEHTVPGDCILDLGAHVGTLSVPAAALGRQVISVDASPTHILCLSESVRLNRLETMKIEFCAVSDQDCGTLEFAENGLFGMVARQGDANTITVPMRRVDSLLSQHGWGGCRLVKMDVEGSELAALKGFGPLMSHSEPPMIIYESNGMTFEMFGYGIQDIRRYLESYGYKTYRMEGERFIYCGLNELQPEAWLDLIALSEKDQARLSSRIDEKWAETNLIERCESWAALPYPNTREYLYNALLMQSAAFLANQRVAAVLNALKGKL